MNQTQTIKAIKAGDQVWRDGRLFVVASVGIDRQARSVAHLFTLDGKWAGSWAVESLRFAR